MQKNCTNLKEWITDLITSFVFLSEENSLKLALTEKFWDEPLVGFSRGSDPLYSFLKEDIGDFYWHPSDVFSAQYPLLDFSPEQLSIISWVLPQTEETKKAQRKEKLYPSQRWARSRLFGERFNDEIRKFVVGKMNSENYPCISPILSPLWETAISAKYGYASKWSERHTAFICGLGTFGLSDGLITRLGKAVRFGSVIVKADIEPDPRQYRLQNEYCLHRLNGKCGKCIKRCPAGAINEKGHDKEKCKKYIRQITAVYAEEKFNIRVNSCGLCQTGVPCESKIPVPVK